VEYATTAFDIYYGTPEISSCHIAKNAQSGVYCRNDAAPQISYSTFEDNMGEGVFKGVGMSNPSIHYNNFLKNAVLVQGFSSIYIDARNNWWGADPPDTGLIWGDPDKSINIKPWLPAPEEKAFRGRK
ncbi:MAG: right-handed parallel beta-helix repeat-containing protein, partial [Thermodesulfobacteriota bacterium]